MNIQQDDGEWMNVNMKIKAEVFLMIVSSLGQYGRV